MFTAQISRRPVLLGVPAESLVMLLAAQIEDFFDGQLDASVDQAVIGVLGRRQPVLELVHRYRDPIANDSQVQINVATSPMAPQFFQSGMDSTLLLIGGGILL